jgi:hypothetical protein
MDSTQQDVTRLLVSNIAETEGLLAALALMAAVRSKHMRQAEWFWSYDDQRRFEMRLLLKEWAERDSTGWLLATYPEIRRRLEKEEPYVLDYLREHYWDGVDFERAAAALLRIADERFGDPPL